MLARPACSIGGNTRTAVGSSSSSTKRWSTSVLNDARSSRPPMPVSTPSPSLWK